MPRGLSYRERPSTRSLRAFTLIELLVVFVIIAVLVSSVLVGGTVLINKARTRDTQVVLQLVRDAVDEFQRDKPAIIEVSQKRSTGRIRYMNRYGQYPADELEMFSKQGLPGSIAPPSNRSLAVGKAEIVPAPGASKYPSMVFYKVGNPAPEYEHRDVAALVLSIETYSAPAALILSKIPEDNRQIACVDAAGNPKQFLDRDSSKNGTWDDDTDTPVRLIVDSWGVPLGYFAQRDYDPDGGASAAALTESRNCADWNQASTEFIRMNGGKPVIFSYGPNGRDQLSKDVQTADNTASLVGDWMDSTDSSPRINNPYNTDNIYADPGLAEKLSAGS